MSEIDRIEEKLDALWIGVRDIQTDLIMQLIQKGKESKPRVVWIPRPSTIKRMGRPEQGQIRAAWLGDWLIEHLGAETSQWDSARDLYRKIRDTPDYVLTISDRVLVEGLK